ncbi:MAG: ABC transporter permease [Balneolaceae bacterium]
MDNDKKTSADSNRSLKRFLRNKFNLIGGIIILLFLLISIFAPVISPHPPNQVNLKMSLQPPSKTNFFGTDSLGRDVFSRIIHGCSASLIVGLGSVGFSLVVGSFLGVIAGYFKGSIGIVIMRFMDALWSFPSIILALGIAASIGPGIKNIIIAIGITFIPGFARVIYSQVLIVREEVYIKAIKSLGTKTSRLIFWHVLPNSITPVIVYSSLMAAQAVIAEAGLSFLGIGVIPPRAAWGNMLRDGYIYLGVAPWVSLFPGAAIFLLVLAFNFVGDGLRDVLDVRMTQ